MDKPFFHLIVLLIFSISQIFGQTSAIYDITFSSTWNSTDHNSIPENAHWSKLVGATHKSPNVFLQSGFLASTGIKNIAEIGNNTVFNSEVTNEINKGEADQYINGTYLNSPTGAILIPELVVNKEFPLLSLVSMIAPSPDWMIAINSFSLLGEDGNWKTSEDINLFVYDAGTDSGTDYASENSISSPFQPISIINGFPFNGNKVGILSIRLKSVSDINDISDLNTITLSPNPTSNGKITIRNLNDNNVKKYDIYNISGSKIKSSYINSNQNSVTLNVQDLQAGIYILILSAYDNISLFRKFEIKK